MRFIFEYAAKFVCGKSDGKIVAPGEYWIAINVHNPSLNRTTFRKKFAIGLPGEKAGPVSKFFNATLGPDQALEIDREDIQRHVDAKGDFLKGFAVLQSDTELDVVAVYTAAGSDRLVSTLHTERVPARKVEIGYPDLVPIPDDHGSFCKRKDGNLIVTVRNQGTARAGPSTTQVDFFKYGTVSRSTPALAAGAAVDLLFPIPPGSFDPDCSFRITADVNNEVSESTEGNNVADGTCIG